MQCSRHHVASRLHNGLDSFESNSSATFILDHHLPSHSSLIPHVIHYSSYLILPLQSPFDLFPLPLPFSLPPYTSLFVHITSPPPPLPFYPPTMSNAMAKLRRIVHRRRSSTGTSDNEKEVLTLTVARDELCILKKNADAGVAPCKSGTLLKYTNVVKRYKPRFFELENGTRKMFAFLKRQTSKEDKESDVKGKINLQLAVISADDSDPTRFVIDVGADLIHLKASTEEERDEWVAVMNASNHYFRNLIKKAVNRAKERAELLDSVTQKQTTIPSTIAHHPSPDNAPPPTGRVSSGSTESDDTVFEDDGVKEAQQSRKALLSELKRVHAVWRQKWVDDPTEAALRSEHDFLVTLADTFRDPRQHPPSSIENARESVKGLMDLIAWCLYAIQTNDEIFERRLKADLTRLMSDGLPVFPASPRKQQQTLRTNFDEPEESDMDSDTEFFDALSRAASMRSGRSRTLPPLDAVLGETDLEEPRVKRLGINEVQRVHTRVISKGFRHVRTSLPKLPGPREKLNVFNILKDSVGKDLSKVVVPITLNEPISFLQRLAEDIEYSELLDKAAEQSDAERRMMYVATMVISHYSSTQGRVQKPFNPLLGETACVIMPNKGKGLRFMAEQVSHHPPVSACYAEGSGASWKYHNAIEIKNKFWGKSLEVFPVGLNHVEIPEYGDHYVYKQVTTCVHNIVVGRLWLDNYGELEITNRTNGGKCIISFSKTGWMSDSRSFGAIKATVYDANGKAKIRLGGNWTKAVWEELPKGRRNVLWTVEERPDETASQMYNMTKWAISLNAEVRDEERKFVAPTDSRYRPDQRALEAGEWRAGTELKAQLEEAQRSRRRMQEGWMA
ncbi:unnamed protein product [Chondrus crispus]|uniref:PH domain-containing protein n=1 Tax=Chondrus crispus TaxID=2769 RepID=R7QDY8_CHOCR|nr:unnamed protein product [Chondrus crispus]CDF35640.1 unnamed protein product [Chondrus crispus]|eukprot:XP_005715459.1 unnamed protein product [Chondrus crispus]